MTTTHPSGYIRFCGGVLHSQHRLVDRWPEKLDYLDTEQCLWIVWTYELVRFCNSQGTIWLEYVCSSDVSRILDGCDVLRQPVSTSRPYPTI